MMACRLAGAKPLPEPIVPKGLIDLLLIGPLGTNQWNLNRNTHFFIHENVFENVVCEMAAILSKGGWVNWNVTTTNQTKLCVYFMGFTQAARCDPHGDGALWERNITCLVLPVLKRSHPHLTSKQWDETHQNVVVYQ